MSYLRLRLAIVVVALLALAGRQAVLPPATASSSARCSGPEARRGIVRARLHRHRSNRGHTRRSGRHVRPVASATGRERSARTPASYRALRTIEPGVPPRPRVFGREWRSSPATDIVDPTPIAMAAGAESRDRNRNDALGCNAGPPPPRPARSAHRRPRRLRNATSRGTAAVPTLVATTSAVQAGELTETDDHAADSPAFAACSSDRRRRLRLRGAAHRPDRCRPGDSGFGTGRRSTLLTVAVTPGANPPAPASPSPVT